MSAREALVPARMTRVALLAPADGFRAALVELADAGAVEIERPTEVRRNGPAAAAFERTRREARHGSIGTAPCLVHETPDPLELEREGRVAELAGEAELEEIAAGAVRHGSVLGCVGWCPEGALAALDKRVSLVGGALVPLESPLAVAPPTLIAAHGATRAFQPLVSGYATLPYTDLNPAAAAGLAYVVMFGMMFGDLAHGALLAAGGVALASWKRPSLANLRPLAPFVIGAGVASMAFGLAFGECFGPTHLVPTLWLVPLSHPTTLLAVAILAGAALLACAYALGIWNRLREGGIAFALTASSGLAGGGCYLGIALLALGWYRHVSLLEAIGGALAVLGALLGGVGAYREARGQGAVAQASVQVFDSVVRIGTNTVSFARLAAFGLTHAALTSLVWSGTRGLWARGPLGAAGAVVLFALGNAGTFGLEGLVAGIQALRLEYYELFSRVLIAEGRPFRPWHVPTCSMKETPCSPG